jgi:hypothetical protein
MGMLASLPDVQRRRLLEGDWDVSEGAAFPEFRRDLHVVPDMAPPSTLFRFRACDYGYVAPTAVIWFAVDYDGTLYAYRELYETRLDAGSLAERIQDIEDDEPSPISTGILDNECWSQRGQIGPSIADTMIGLGVPWSKADKGPGSRMYGKEDHLYDALRYGVQSRSVRQTEHPSERRWRAQRETYKPVDQTFGY